MNRTREEKPRRGLTLLAALLLLCLIISSAVVIALNARFLYYHDIESLKLEESSGLDAESIRRNYDALIDYNLLWNRGPLQLPDFPMSEAGQIHFREVKLIFDCFQILFLVSLFGLIGLRFGAKALRIGPFARIAGFSCLGIVGILGLFALIGWDTLFVVFHQVFFNNDFWIFDAATDPVITILPDRFFLHEALLILGVVLAGALLCLIPYHKLSNKKQNQEMKRVEEIKA